MQIEYSLTLNKNVKFLCGYLGHQGPHPSPWSQQRSELNSGEGTLRAYHGESPLFFQQLFGHSHVQADWFFCSRRGATDEVLYDLNGCTCSYLQCCGGTNICAPQGHIEDIWDDLVISHHGWHIRLY